MSRRLNRWLAVLALFFWSLSATADALPQIAIIIDDVGSVLTGGRAALQLPGPVTYAFLPRTPHSERLAREAFAAGKELMLHLPMQSIDEHAMGPGGLSLHMEEAEFRRTLEEDLRSVPFVVGVNNHMGSLLTQHPGAMTWLMASLQEKGGLYFVDSRTNRHTVAEETARLGGVPASRRDVFLDNERDPEKIRRQFRQLIRKAKRSGSAIGIGHPYSETIDTLRAELAKLEAYGVELVPVSTLIETQRRIRLWRASSSPSPKVAKNSKPSQSSTCCAEPALR